MRKIKKGFTLIELIVSMALAAILMSTLAFFLVYITRMQGYIQNGDKEFANADEFRMVITSNIQANQDKGLTFYTRQDTASNITTSGYNTKIFSYDSEAKYYYYDATKGEYGGNNGSGEGFYYQAKMNYLMSVQKVSSYQMIEISLQNPTDFTLILSFRLNISQLTMS